MIRLDFKEYIDKLSNEKSVNTPTEHYYEDVSRFIMLFRTREDWEYYAIIYKDDITDFAEFVDIDDSIDFFRRTYCSNHIKIEDISELDLSEDIVTYEEPSGEFVEYDDNYNDDDQEVIAKEVLDPGDDIVEEATDYNDFLSKTFDNFETRVLNSLKKLGIDKGYTEKTFGDFLRGLFNSVNTVAFGKKVKQFLRADLVSGMLSAESETGVQIGFTDAYDQKLNKLQAEQIDGYTINGKKWFGIKGVTKQIQSKVTQTVQEGLQSNKSLTEITEDVKNDFSGFSDHRAGLIARTETNKILNEGKLLGYKETGLEGGKTVRVALDNRTSPICRRMHIKYADTPIGLDEPFIDSDTLKEFTTPPFHPNCRSSISFSPK